LGRRRASGGRLSSGSADCARGSAEHERRYVNKSRQKTGPPPVGRIWLQPENWEEGEPDKLRRPPLTGQFGLPFEAAARIRAASIDIHEPGESLPSTGRLTLGPMGGRRGVVCKTIAPDPSARLRAIKAIEKEQRGNHFL